jgi:NAD(P)-dependent dehydrogenase (short-subunit alcohol dehydrogenase family)
MARWVVTGGSSGIGLATVDRALARGDEVTVLDLHPCPRQAATSVQCDLGDAAAIATGMQAVTGSVDVLVNNAGVPGTHDADVVLRVNVLGVRELTSLLVARRQLAAGAVVVNVASIAGRRWSQRIDELRALLRTTDFEAGVAWIHAHPMSGKDAYTFSKECVIVLTKQWGELLRTTGVRCVSVSPGPAETAIIGDFRASMGDARIDWTAEQVGRLAAPDDVAAAIAAMAHPSMAWVNAVDLPVDGGLSGGMVGGWVHPAD